MLGAPARLSTYTDMVKKGLGMRGTFRETVAPLFAEMTKTAEDVERAEARTITSARFAARWRDISRKQRAAPALQVGHLDGLCNHPSALHRPHEIIRLRDRALHVADQPIDIDLELAEGALQ